MSSAPSLQAIGRFLRRVAIGLALLIGIYMLAALAGSVVIKRDKAKSDPADALIYIYGDAFHTDIIIPVALFDRVEKTLLDELQMGQAGYVAFGWGSQTAYTSLLEITDLSLGVMFRALAMDDAVIHVSPLPLGFDRAATGARPLSIDDQGAQHLLNYVEESFARTADGGIIMLQGVSHGHGDVFYRARGRFSPLQTCNVWVGRALHAAGIKTGFWTPFAWGLP